MSTFGRVPVPLTFSLVLVVVLALIIFFGAWAASTDVGGQRTLAFGLPGTTAASSGSNVNSSDSGPFQVARLDSQATSGDTWWGNAFLKACPLH
ncbi:MAG: hypothetical protein Ct9H300mP11_01270 [Chloroflexota bacterium]|nr:MAG: hypothetical protein EGP13_03490 [SAR202 cluster bacterium]MEC9014371.1 hypothetical protein [Chloroflexota bacterium]GIT42191.1 MAG: hypothetical protein Ct9H300mP11_01270 [Chloroflexota bacterium]